MWRGGECADGVPVKIAERYRRPVEPDRVNGVACCINRARDAVELAGRAAECGELASTARRLASELRAARCRAREERARRLVYRDRDRARPPHFAAALCSASPLHPQPAPRPADLLDDPPPAAPVLAPPASLDDMRLLAQVLVTPAQPGPEEAGTEVGRDAAAVLEELRGAVARCAVREPGTPEVLATLPMSVREACETAHDMGFPLGSAVRAAVLLGPEGGGPRLVECLLALQHLRDLGYPEEPARSALVAHGLDTQTALRALRDWDTDS